MYVWMCEFSFILKMILEFSQWNPCTFGILLDKLIVLRCEKCVTAKVQSKFYLVTLSLTYTHKYTDSIHMHWKMKNRSFIKTHRKIFVFISIVWWMFMSCFSFAGSQNIRTYTQAYTHVLPLAQYGKFLFVTICLCCNQTCHLYTFPQTYFSHFQMHKTRKIYNHFIVSVFLLFFCFLKAQQIFTIQSRNHKESLLEV